MEIKVQCACGAKFSFDVEPVDGQVPEAVGCPKCGADLTSTANAAIAQKLSTPSIGAGPFTPPTKSRLKVSTMHEKPAPPTTAAGEAAAAAGKVLCSKHPNNIAESRCVNCDKPICMECMSVFGYFCSISCRYQAQNKGIPIPKCPHQKVVQEAMWWRKVGSLAGAVVMAVIGLLALYVWFWFVGSKPKPVYKMAFNTETAPLDVRFFGKDRLLLLKPDALVLHDIKKKQDIWSSPLSQSPATNATGEATGTADEEDVKLRRILRNAKLFPGQNSIWVAMDRTFSSFDPQTGAPKQTVNLPGRILEHYGDSNSMMLICNVRENVDDSAKAKRDVGPSFKRAAVLVNLDNGEAKTEQVTAMPTQREWVNEELPAGISPTQGFLMSRELDEAEGKKPVKTVYSRFVPTGANAVEMRVGLVKANLVAVESMKKAGPSAINENTSAATSSRTVAEEVFNDIKRSRTGGIRSVDESTYVVEMRRLLAEGTKTWTGNVTGPPALFPMNTVDLLVANKDLYFFDKQNNKTAEAKLTYPVDNLFISAAPRLAPCMEEQGVLYFFDQGVLTAFELPSGNVKWRLPSVWISKVISDGHGNLYVNTTTGSPDDIQYPDQIKMDNGPRPILLKVEAASGKILWKGNMIGSDSSLSGKFLYSMNAHNGGFGLPGGLSDALGSYAESTEHFHLYRINPANGKAEWDYYNRGAPEQVDFDGNKIVLRFPYEVRVLKYLTFTR